MTVIYLALALLVCAFVFAGFGLWWMGDGE